MGVSAMNTGRGSEEHPTDKKDLFDCIDRHFAPWTPRQEWGHDYEYDYEYE